MTARPPWRAFGALWFCYFATIGAFNPYAPLWFKELGFSTLAIGAIASLQAWTRVLAPYLWGWAGDASGERVRLIQVGAAATLISSAGLLMAHDYATVATIVVMLYLANGAVVPLAEAALARHLATATGMDSARYGRVRMWGSAGFICAVVTYGWVLQWFGIDLFPWIVVGMCALLLVAARRLPARRDEVAAHAAGEPVLAVLRRPQVAWFFAGIFFTVLAHTALYAFFSLYLDELGYGRSVVGMLWAVSVIVEIGFFWFQGRFFDRVEPHRWLLWAAALSVLRFGGIAAFGSYGAVLVATQLLHAVTFAAQHAACIMLINRHFAGSLRGRGQALYSVIGYGLSGVVGGVAGGALTSRFGFEAVFWAAAAAAAAGWAATWAAYTAERRATA
jgi:PPP family 3-phenylpropionic acid transporter